jgi:Spy/CpxP family protein refolding chaperone
MSKKTLTWLLIFSVIINISTLATFGYHRWFEPKRPRFERGRSPQKEFFRKELGLTDEQWNKVQALKSEFWQQIKPLKTQLDEEHRHLFQIQNQDTVNIEEVYRSIDKISEIQKQMQRMTVENILAHQSILTPEQRKKFFSMMAKWMPLGESKRRHSPGMNPDEGHEDSLKNR